MEKEDLYFIAIIPAKEICNEITAFQLDFANQFEGKAALKIIPHITLKAPFKLPVSKHSDLQQWFQKLFVISEPFQIELRNFGAFHNKYHPVVYVNVVMNKPLSSLQNEIIKNFRLSYPEVRIADTEFNFTPHITVAYRDLKPGRFSKAWQVYKTKEYKAFFDVSSFHLLQHNEKMWNIIDTKYIM